MYQKIVEQVAKEFNIPETQVRKVYKEFIKEIINVMNDTDFSEYNFNEQKTITLPFLGEFRVLEGNVKFINKRKNGRTKTKEDTGQEQCDPDNS